MNLLIAIFATGAIWFVFQKNREDRRTFLKTVQSLDSRITLLQQFICESTALRSDAERFISKGFNCSHDMLSPEHEKCICVSFAGRANALFGRSEFYSASCWEEDIGEGGGLDDYFEDEAKKRAAENQKILLSYFERLHGLSPKNLETRHVEWLRRKNLADFEMARYLSWILPELRHGHSRLTSEAAIKVLDELESRLGGRAGNLCDVVMFSLKPEKDGGNSQQPPS